MSQDGEAFVEALKAKMEKELLLLNETLPHGGLSPLTYANVNSYGKHVVNLEERMNFDPPTAA